MKISKFETSIPLNEDEFMTKLATLQKYNYDLISEIFYYNIYPQVKKNPSVVAKMEFLKFKFNY